MSFCQMMGFQVWRDALSSALNPDKGSSKRALPPSMYRGTLPPELMVQSFLVYES